MIKLTALWKNKDKNGNLYLSGYLGDARMMIFPVKDKKEEKYPDYEVYVAEKKKPETQPDINPTNPTNTVQASDVKDHLPQNSQDDLPF